MSSEKIQLCVKSLLNLLHVFELLTKPDIVKETELVETTLTLLPNTIRSIEETCGIVLPKEITMSIDELRKLIGEKREELVTKVASEVLKKLKEYFLKL